MDVVELHEGALDQAARLVAAVDPAQLDGPTPCTEWDVRALPAPPGVGQPAQPGGRRGGAAATRRDRTYRLPFGELPGASPIDRLAAYAGRRA